MRVGVISWKSLLRRGLIAMLRDANDVAIVWEVEDLREVNRSGSSNALDLILFEAKDDTLDRVLLEELRAQFPKARIAVIYADPSEQLIAETLLAGAQGCISEVRDGDVFMKAVHCLAGGELWANRRATAMALEMGATNNASKSWHSTQLTRREWEVFSLVAVGKRNRQIAETLYISEQTVKRHLYSLYRKLHVPSRLEAGLLFYRMNSASEESPVGVAGKSA